jgi:hypothetical protein
MKSNILNIIAMNVSIIAGLFLFALAIKTKLLKKGLFLLTFGIFIGLVLHSAFEFLESIEMIKVEFLIEVMPIFVSFGSILILLGGLEILYNVMTPIKEIIKNLDKIKADEAEINITSDIISNKNNELSYLFSLIVEKTKKLADSKKKLREYNKILEKNVEARTKELKEKVDTLEKFHKLVVGRELKMKELKERIKDAENKCK